MIKSAEMVIEGNNGKEHFVRLFLFLYKYVRQVIYFVEIATPFYQDS